jgi:hypothetical protein
MKDLLKRYLAGEHETVWTELGTDAVPKDLQRVAESIATETMRRVRHNLDVLVDRLNSEGFRFANPPSPKREDANGRYGCVRALPRKDTEALIQDIERLAGALPLSVKAFYREVGCINLQGALDDALTTADDPLMVSPLEYLPAAWDEWAKTPEHERDVNPFAWEFAPDGLHKQNVSGGAPFRIVLPSPGADGLVQEENWRIVSFVSYLRTSLKWAGFPGLRHRSGEDRQENRVARLAEGFQPF